MPSIHSHRRTSGASMLRLLHPLRQAQTEDHLVANNSVLGTRSSVDEPRSDGPDDEIVEQDQGNG